MRERFYNNSVHERTMINDPSQINDLRSCLDYIENVLGKLIRVNVEVDPKYEIAGIIHKMANQGNFNAVIFENVKGYDVPVVANLTKATTEQIFKTGPRPYPGIVEIIERAQREPIMPKIVPKTGAPCKEVIIKDDIDLMKMFPICTQTELDGGPYISSGLVFAKDPETGESNWSIHRMCVKGPSKVNIWLCYFRHLHDFYRKAEAMGRPLEVAIAIGVEPAIMIGSTGGKAGLVRQLGKDHEAKLSCAFAQRPIELVKCETVDIEVPARAEIVLEGEIPPHIREMEDSNTGKGFAFPEVSGYLGDARDVPIVNIRCVTHRRDPLYHTVVTTHGMSESMFDVVTFSSLVKEITDIAPKQILGISTSTGVLAIKYRKENIEDEGMQVNVLMRALSVAKDQQLAIVVDEDVDIDDAKEIFRAISSRCEAPDAIFMVPGARAHEFNPRSEDGILTKIGIDATIPLRKKKLVTRPVFRDVGDLSRYIAPMQTATQVRDYEVETISDLAEKV